MNASVLIPKGVWERVCSELRDLFRRWSNTSEGHPARILDGADGSRLFNHRKAIDAAAVRDVSGDIAIDTSGADDTLDEMTPTCALAYDLMAQSARVAGLLSDPPRPGAIRKLRQSLASIGLAVRILQDRFPPEDEPDGGAA